MPTGMPEKACPGDRRLAPPVDPPEPELPAGSQNREILLSYT
jgi:hypothetical protein